MTGRSAMLARGILKAARPWLLWLVGLFIAGLYLFPVYWMVASAFKIGRAHV